MGFVTVPGSRRAVDPHDHRCHRCGAALNMPRCDGGLHRCTDCMEVERQTARYEKWLASGMTMAQADKAEAIFTRRAAAQKRRVAEKGRPSRAKRSQNALAA